MTPVEMINAEMQKHPDNPAIEEIGHYLIDKGIQSIPEGKTIAGALKLLEDYARKHKKGSCGVCPASVAFPMIDEYFGIKGGTAASYRQVAGKLNSGKADISLEDFF